MDHILTFLVVLAALIIYGVGKQFLTGYLSEKGRNLATKEDIAKITESIEHVKHSYSLLLEEYRRKENLRLTAADQRLTIHQRAFAKWWNLVQALHSEHVGKHVSECQEFWVENSLYLSEEVSVAFRLAYHAASDHETLKRAAREGPTSSRDDVRRNFDTIIEAGNAIRAAVELPPLNESELPKQNEGAA